MNEHAAPSVSPLRVEGEPAPDTAGSGAVSPKPAPGLSDELAVSGVGPDA
ncbi:MAG: hypothetical protein QOH43_4035 [Solirubrobacteraceae bacterium]|jgi:hypothetical protein|nr:hypothetical protein [Solirubrobacteraceae bacterium]